MASIVNEVSLEDFLDTLVKYDKGNVCVTNAYMSASFKSGKKGENETEYRTLLTDQIKRKMVIVAIQSLMGILPGD
jgi:hypothetical protein